MHLGGKEIPHTSLAILANQAEEAALLLYSSSTTCPLTAIAEDKSPSILSDNADPLLPPTKPKATLKPSNFFPVFADQIPPRQTDISNGNDSDEENKPGVYSKVGKGVGDGTHFITASFVKSNNKIKDKLLTQVRYFLDLMNAKIEGIKFYPLSTNKSLPILTSSADKNFPTTGTKIRDYFHVQNKFFLTLGTRNKPKVPPQKVDSDGQFHFDENRVYYGPDRIMGIMLISAPCNLDKPSATF
jgi:hypothetical protein